MRFEALLRRTLTLTATVAMLAAAPATGFASAPAHAMGLAVGATDVTGLIASDTTWTADGSPYVLTGPVTIPAGVTLTIEAGVTVDGLLSTSFSPRPVYTPWLTVLGDVKALGSADAPVLLHAETSGQRPLFNGSLDPATPASGHVSLSHVDIFTDYTTPFDAPVRLDDFSLSDSVWRMKTATRRSSASIASPWSATPFTLPQPSIERSRSAVRRLQRS